MSSLDQQMAIVTMIRKCRQTYFSDHLY